MRVDWDDGKNEWLKRKRGISFEDALAIFERPYCERVKLDHPLQFKVIGFVEDRLVTVILETRFDEEGEYEWLITLWPATKSERKDYEERT